MIGGDGRMTTLAAIGKKALLFLLGDKKGRKAVGYTIGIAVFIALLPLIVVMGLFHWLLGDGGAEMREQVGKEIASSYTETVETTEGGMENRDDEQVIFG